MSKQFNSIRPSSIQEVEFNKVATRRIAPLTVEVAPVAPKKTVRKLRTWVKVAGGMVISSVITLGCIFGSTTTDFISVEVQRGDTTCSIIEGINGVGTCDDYSGYVFKDNAVFEIEGRNTDEIKIGETLVFRQVEKRFVK